MKGIILLFIVMCSLRGFADDQGVGERTDVPLDPTLENPYQPADQKKKNELVIAPVPFYNPSQMWGLALTGQYIFHNDQKDSSPPSVVALAGFYTQKKSYGGILGYMGKINDDALRIGVVVGAATFNSDFYGVGHDLDKKDNHILLEQKADFAGLQIMPRIAEHLYLGPSLIFSDMKNSFDVPAPPIPIPTDKLDVISWVPGLKGQYDSRDNSFYPTEGTYANLNIQFHDERWGNGPTFQKVSLNYRGYGEILEDNILAWELGSIMTFGNAPFYALPSLGMQDLPRGFVEGKYRDKIMWAGQVEDRYRFNRRWGGVLFAGFGDVIPNWGDFSLKEVLPSGGAGLRFRIAEVNPLDFRTDVAYGDNQWNFYFSVGQAF